jgi:hypothetical protein
MLDAEGHVLLGPLPITKEEFNAQVDNFLKTKEQSKSRNKMTLNQSAICQMIVEDIMNFIASNDVPVEAM